MRQTEHYGLNLWDLSDRIQMEDFNGDNQKLDAALAALAAGGGGVEQIGLAAGNAAPAHASIYSIWDWNAQPEWEKWSIVMLMGNITEPASGVTPYLQLHNGGSSYDPALKLSFAPGGFLFILLPLKDISNEAKGIFISSGKTICVRGDTLFKDVSQVTLGGETASGGSGNVLIRQVRFLGIR